MQKNSNLKIVKLILIIVGIIFTTGWKNLEQMKKDVQEVIDANIICRYLAASEEVSFTTNIEKIEIATDSRQGQEGLKIEFNDSGWKFLVYESGWNNKYVIGNTTYTIRERQQEYFLNNYKINGYCQSEIYIHSSNELYAEDQRNAIGAAQFKRYILEKVNVGGKECHHDNATKCIKKYTQDKGGLPTYYVELGYYKDNITKETKKYLRVAQDEYSEIHNEVDVNSNGGGLSFSPNGRNDNIKAYFSIGPEAVKDIWRDGETLISEKEVKFEIDGNVTPTYIISGPNSDNYDFGYEVESEKAPDIDGKPDSSPANPSAKPEYESTMNYDSICENSSISGALVIIGYVIEVIKWIAPLIIIVLGMVDYGKAVVSSDDNALKSATSTLIRRFIAGVSIFFIVTLVDVFADILLETDIQSGKYGVCTDCLMDPAECSKKVEEYKKREEEIKNQNQQNQDKFEEEADKNTESGGTSNGGTSSGPITVSKTAEAIATEAERIFNDKELIKKFKYQNPSAAGNVQKRAAGYNDMVLGIEPSLGYYYADCNSFVGIIIKRATGIGGDPTKEASSISDKAHFSIASPGGDGPWQLRNSYYSKYFEVVEGNLSLSNVFAKAKRGDLIGSNGDGSTHIQVYVGNNCVIGNTGGNGVVISRRCNSNIPHSKGRFTIIRIKEGVN